MAVVPLFHVGSRGATVREYLATIGPLARLVWRTGKGLFLVSTALMLLAGLLPAANIVVVSALLQTLVDAAADHGRQVGATPRFGVLLVTLAAVNLLGQLAERLGKTVTELHAVRIGNDVQLRVADKAGAVDLASFEDRGFHDEMRTVADEAVYRPPQMVSTLLEAVSSIATVLSLAGILVVWQPWLLGALLLAAVATLTVSARFGSAHVELVTSRAELERRRQYLNMVLVSDQAAKEVRLFGLRELLVGRLAGILDVIYRQDRRLAMRELSWSGGAGFLMAAVQVALIAYTAVQALDGTIDVGAFNRYMLAIVQLGGMLPMIAFTAGALHEHNLYAQRMFRFLATQPVVESRPPAATRSVTDVTAGEPGLVFDRVSFRYPGTDHEVLRDVSFAVRGGESVAFVGENGAGKSTVVKLLAGLYAPTGGRIRLNGIDVTTLDRDALRAQLSVVFQDFVIYHLPVWDNVGFGRLRWLDDTERITAAARRSGLHRTVEQLPNGYSTVLGRYWNLGHELSGGQRQMVALARALLRQAPVLVLDEPSSALDVRTETAFFEQLLEGGRDDPHRCTVLISHRLATVRRADRILVLEGGRLVEEGSHERLMDRAGLYAEMFHLQSAAYREGPAPSEGRV